MQQKYMQNIEDLLPRYFDGDVTLEEGELVKAWLQESSENHKMAEQVYLLYLAADTACAHRKVATEKALKKVKSRMVARTISSWEWVQRIAAVLLIPVLVAWFLQYNDSNDKIAQLIEIKTNPGMITKVILPDSTLVFLNSNSSLRYPVEFGDSREVTLDGEAYFEVTKNPKKRFFVSTPHCSQIEVLGTHFNVEAYADELHVLTTLLEGSVRFLYKGASNRMNYTMMSPGEKLVYNSALNEVKLYKTTCLSETAWKEGKIIFKDTPLKEALRLLEKRFNVKFIIRNDKWSDSSFTGTFVEQRLERILEYFKISSKVRWRYLENPDIQDERSEIEIY